MHCQDDIVASSRMHSSISMSLGVPGSVPARTPELSQTAVMSDDKVPASAKPARRDIHVDLGVHPVNSSAPRAAAFHVLRHRPHDLHVLLRHRLLRQPQGFEGLRVIPEELLIDDLALAHRDRRPSTLCSTSGPWPAPRQICLTATRSPASMKSLISSKASASQVSRSCSHRRMTASRPTYGPGSGQPSGVRTMTSGSYSSRKASMSPAFHASNPASHDLHVLLRHRPRSIPQAQESA